MFDHLMVEFILSFLAVTTAFGDDRQKWRHWGYRRGIQNNELVIIEIVIFRPKPIMMDFYEAWDLAEKEKAASGGDQVQASPDDWDDEKLRKNLTAALRKRPLPKPLPKSAPEKEDVEGRPVTRVKTKKHHDDDDDTEASDIEEKPNVVED